MKLYTLYIFIIAWAFNMCVKAQSYDSSITSPDEPELLYVKDATVENMNGVVAVRIWFVVQQNIPSHRSVVLVPELADTLQHRSVDLPAIYVSGRNQYIYHKRNPLDEQSEIMEFRKKKNKDLTIDYLRSVPYQPWMETSVLRMRIENCQCNVRSDRGREYLCSFNKTEPSPAVIELFPTYKVPKAEAVKVRSEKGSAYLCFVVDKTDIKADYMSNPQELSKIRKSIDLVKNDPNVEIQSMSISGYASPEGNLEHNIELSQGRTEALKKRIESSGVLKNVEIKAESRGENWIGFREYLNTHSKVPQREALFLIMDEDIDPDAKEQKMKKTASEGFRYCLNNCFPKLRRTDYDISYVVRPFTLEESEEIFNTKPKNLSLNEIYRLADKYKNDEAKYRDIMQKTYDLYSDNIYANLMMAYLALRNKDVVSAEHYLKKVSACPEKTLNEGIVAYLKGDTDKALIMVQEAANAGLDAAKKQLEEFKKLKQQQ